MAPNGAYTYDDFGNKTYDNGGLADRNGLQVGNWSDQGGLRNYSYAGGGGDQQMPGGGWQSYIGSPMDTFKFSMKSGGGMGSAAFDPGPAPQLPEGPGGWQSMMPSFQRGVPSGPGMPGGAFGNEINAANSAQNKYGYMDYQAQQQERQMALQARYAERLKKMDLQAQLAQIEAQRMSHLGDQRYQLELQRRGNLYDDYSSARDNYEQYGIRMGDAY